MNKKLEELNAENDTGEKICMISWGFNRRTLILPNLSIGKES